MYMSMRYSAFFVLRLWLYCLFGFQLIYSSASVEKETGFPFDRVGEELEYALKWGPFKVGSGYLRTYPLEQVDGVECFHVSLEVKTNSFADKVYKVRSRFDSYISREHGRPVKYRISQHEGNTNRDATVYFDWENLTATYHRDGEDPKEPIEIEELSWDPLSVVYYFRRVLRPDAEMIQLPATDGKKFLHIDVEGLGLRKLKTQMGEFSAMKVKPNTKEMKGVFKKSKKSTISMWYSNDENRYPLLIKSKVIVGSFNAELKKVRWLNES